MFRTVCDQVSLWEAVIAEELPRLPDELAPVDALLDDEAFFGPFEARRRLVRSPSCSMGGRTNWPRPGSTRRWCGTTRRAGWSA